MKKLLVFVALVLLATSSVSADRYRDFVGAVRDNDAAKVRAFLDENPGFLAGVKRMDLLDPLCIAARNSNFEIAEILVSRGADVNALAGRCETPLHKAVIEGHKGMAGFLLSKGADINAQDGRGSTALHKTAEKGNREMVEFLLSKGADINAKDEQGGTPLFMTIASMFQSCYSAKYFEEKEKMKAVAVYLISKGADVNASNKNGETALHFAVMAHDRELVTLLVSRGANINVKNKAGETPLHQAAMSGERDITFRLMAKGGDLFLKNNYGVSPFSLMLLQFHTSPEGPFLEMLVITAFFLGIALIVVIRVRLRHRRTGGIPAK